MTRSSRSIWSAKLFCTFASLPSSRSITIWKARNCNTPWRNGCGNWAGVRSKWWMMIGAGRRPGPSLAPALHVWWPRFCLGKVGVVAAREVSRFARNSREWQQLIEVCRVVDTVLIDQETVYTPRQSGRDSCANSFGKLLRLMASGVI